MGRDFFCGFLRSGPLTLPNSISSGAALRRGSEDPLPARIPSDLGSKKLVLSRLGNSLDPFFFAKGLSGFPLALS